MAQLGKMSIKHLRSEGCVTVSWKQGSFLGIGGSESKVYKREIFKFDNGAEIVVFVQADMSHDKEMKIGAEFQFGCQNDEVFLVLHDKSRKIYQFRFVESANLTTKAARSVSELTKNLNGYDISWIAGDYLCNFPE